MTEARAVETASPVPLSLAGELTIYRAHELKQTLLAELARCEGTLALDLSQVTELDSTGVQLLLLTRQLASARQKRVVLVAASASVKEVLELLNLERSFSPPAPEPTP